MNSLQEGYAQQLKERGGNLCQIIILCQMIVSNKDHDLLSHEISHRDCISKDTLQQCTYCHELTEQSQLTLRQWSDMIVYYLQYQIDDTSYLMLAQLALIIVNPGRARAKTTRTTLTLTKSHQIKIKHSTFPSTFKFLITH